MTVQSLIARISFSIFIFAFMFCPVANASLFDDLIHGHDSDEVIAESAARLPMEGETTQFIEAGMTLQVRGMIISRDGKTFIEDQHSGETFELLDTSMLDEDSIGGHETARTVVSAEGMVTVACNGDNQTHLALTKVIKPSRLPSIDWKRLAEAMSPIGVAHAIDRSYGNITFPTAVEAEGQQFLSSYRYYRQQAMSELAKRYRASHGTSNPGKVAFGTITSNNKAAYNKYSAEYQAAVAACDSYIAACKRAAIWENVSTARTYIHMDKSTALLRIVDRDDDTTLLCVPFAYGGNPDGGQKRRNGDYRTPETPRGATAENTPFYVGRRAPHTVASGMTTRCMGVSSKNGDDSYWVRHGMNIAIHGTPATWSMGLRASHGCCRVLDRHVIHVYALTATNCPIVIDGL